MKFPAPRRNTVGFQVGVLLLAPLIPAGVSAWYHPSPLEERQGITSELEERIKAAEIVLWLDARDEATRQRASLVWANRLSEMTWEDDLPHILEAWSPGTVLAVFCNDGGCELSKQVAERLRKETGIESILVIEGGEPEAIRLHNTLKSREHNDHKN